MADERLQRGDSRRSGQGSSDHAPNSVSLTDELGIYFSRSGSFRHFPTSTLIHKYLPALGSDKEAKNVFIHEIQNA
jgi:hypothetical protein